VDLLARRVLLIANPASRRGARYFDAALAAFRTAGVACDAVLTERAGHGAALATQRAAEYDAIFTLGGDGTAMEVVDALAGGTTPVGILPGGTGNLLARTLGIPLKVRRAVPALLQGEVARIDLGRLGTGRRFAFAVGAGVDASMIERTPPWLKRYLGVIAYLQSWIRAIVRRETFLVRATIDGERVERESFAVLVANFGAVLDDKLRLGPNIRQDDGVLDLCIFSPTSFRDTVRIVWRLLRQDYRADPCVLYRRGHDFVVETVPPRLVQADGEMMGMTPITVAVEPLAAMMLVPKRRRSE